MIRKNGTKIKKNIEQVHFMIIITQSLLLFTHICTYKFRIADLSFFVLAVIEKNLSVQCQAIVVGFLRSVVAIIMGAFRNGTVSLDHTYLLGASSLVTASLASFVLELITAGVIVFSRHCHINPDNVATPIAASLGDITSLALLSWISTILYESINKQDWLAPLVIACYILVTPLWVWIACYPLQKMLLFSSIISGI